MDVTKQEEVDKLMLELDGTDNKSKSIKMLFLMLHNNNFGTAVNFELLGLLFHLIHCKCTIKLEER